jgi:hypothetical protein
MVNKNYENTLKKIETNTRPVEKEIGDVRFTLGGTPSGSTNITFRQIIDFRVPAAVGKEILEFSFILAPENVSTNNRYGDSNFASDIIDPNTPYNFGNGTYKLSETMLTTSVITFGSNIDFQVKWVI